MSHLKLFSPGLHDFDGPLVDGDRETFVVSFESYKRRRVRTEAEDSLVRAQAIYQNRICPRCSHPVIKPIELADANLSRANCPIPGTATLVGFHCDSCASEWPV